MVLLSEWIVSTGAILILSITGFEYMLVRSSRNHALLSSISMLGVYSATRLLLETESPQSVIPGFVVVILVLTEILKRGKYYPREMSLRIITIFLTSYSLLLFSFLKGLVFLSQRAQELKLDRELTWYHPFLITASSWRWCLIVLALFVPPFGSKRGWIIMAVKIALIWVLCEATGTSVATSPWGAMDEILLDKNSLLYLILGLVTFAIAMDQIIASIVAGIEEEDRRTGIETEKIAWDDIKGKLTGNPIVDMKRMLLFNEQPPDAFHRHNTNQVSHGPDH